MIDEQLLSPDRIKTVCASLVGVPDGSIADFDEFYHRIEGLNAENSPMYSLHLKRPMPLVDVSKSAGAGGAAAPSSDVILSSKVQNRFMNWI